VRRGSLGGHSFRILERSRPSKLTVQVAPGGGFGACEPPVGGATAFRVGIDEKPEDFLIRGCTSYILTQFPIVNRTHQ
jgi:hypothetical protein